METETLVSVATLAAVFIGGIWAYYLVVRRRMHAVRLDFTVDVRFVGLQGAFWLVSFDATVNNVGFVRHEISRFEFNAKYLERDDPVITTQDYGGQVDIGRDLTTGSWLAKDWKFTFLEPGAETLYSFVSRVPKEASFVLLHGLLDYGRRSAVHTAEKLSLVPEAPSDAVAWF